MDIYTMHELELYTTTVIDKINQSGSPAIITKHGRAVAVVTPLEGVKVESIALSAASDFVRSLTEDRDEEVRVRDTAQAATALGVELEPPPVPPMRPNPAWITNAEGDKKALKRTIAAAERTSDGSWY